LLPGYLGPLSMIWSWGGMVRGRGGVVWGRSWVVRLCLRIHRSSFICNFSDVPVVVVSSVLDMLSSAIGKSNGIRSAYSVAIRSFTSIKSSLGVVISNCVLISVRLWCIFWLLVWGGSRVVGRLVNNRGRVVCRLVNNRCWVVCRLVNNRCWVVGGFVNHGGWMVGRFVNHWGWMVGGLRMVGLRCWLVGWHRGMVHRSRFVCRGGVIRGRAMMVRGRARMVRGGSRMVRCRSRVVRGG